MTWLRIVVLAIGLCVFASAWSWLDRTGERGIERWKMRLLVIVLALLLLVPALGGFPSSHPSQKGETGSSLGESGLAP